MEHPFKEGEALGKALILTGRKYNPPEDLEECKKDAHFFATRSFPAASQEEINAIVAGIFKAWSKLWLRK